MNHCAFRWHSQRMFVSVFLVFFLLPKKINKRRYLARSKRAARDILAIAQLDEHIRSDRLRYE